MDDQREDSSWSGGAQDGAARWRHLHGPWIPESESLQKGSLTVWRQRLFSTCLVYILLRLTPLNFSHRPASKYTTALEMVSRTIFPFNTSSDLLLTESLPIHRRSVLTHGRVIAEKKPSCPFHHWIKQFSLFFSPKLHKKKKPFII